MLEDELIPDNRNSKNYDWDDFDPEYDEEIFDYDDNDIVMGEDESEDWFD